jgi:type 1 glutamine amidotransferase
MKPTRRESIRTAVMAMIVACIPSLAVAVEKAPLKLLLVTGGCCHNYRFQAMAMEEAFRDAGVDVNWTVVNEGGTGTQAMIDLYNDPNWAEGFDVVIHNECFADTDDTDYIRKITKPHHEGANAVVIHCAMHTYRSATIDDWRQLLGVTSRHHEHQSRYPVDVVATDHPIMAGFPAGYKTEMDELYIIEKTWPQTTVLATNTSEKTGEKQPVFWTNQYGKARVFGTTYGHSDDTFRDPVFLRTFIRGTLWAAGRPVEAVKGE